jgi:hypothetical protein
VLSTFNLIPIPNKPVEAYSAPSCYLALGPNRSIKGLAGELKIGTARTRGWSRSFNWTHRRRARKLVDNPRVPWTFRDMAIRLEIAGSMARSTADHPANVSPSGRFSGTKWRKPSIAFMGLNDGILKTQSKTQIQDTINLQCFQPQNTVRPLKTQLIPRRKIYPDLLEYRHACRTFSGRFWNKNAPHFPSALSAAGQLKDKRRRSAPRLPGSMDSRGTRIN